MMESPARSKESLATLPAEYWQADGTGHGAVVNGVSMEGSLILAVIEMPVGNRLNVNIFYANGYEFDSIRAVANIVSKAPHIAKDHRAYKYGLQFVQISEQDREKLKALYNHLNLERPAGMGDVAVGNPSLEKVVVPPSTPSAPVMQSAGACKSYENGKCLKTRAFCDLCNSGDEADHVRRQGGRLKARKHESSPFTSCLSKFVDHVRSSFQKH
jgi:hypothetical protein